MPEVHDDPDRDVGVVRDGEDVEVLGRDVPVRVEHRLLRPVEQALPVVAHHQDDGEARLPESLDQHEGLEKLVQGPITTGENDEPVRILEEHHLADEEVAEVQRQVLVGVGNLLVRQLDVQADAARAGLGGPFVGGLHDAAPAAGDDGETRPGQFAGGLLGELVVRVARVGPGGAEDRHCGPHRSELLIPFRELGHDPEDAPEVFDGLVGRAAVMIILPSHDTLTTNPGCSPPGSAARSGTPGTPASSPCRSPVRA